MTLARILLVGGDDATQDALAAAFADKGRDAEILPVSSEDDALHALVSERLQLCVVHAPVADFALARSICEDAREAGVRIPIIALLDQDDADVEHALVDAGALAALPWDTNLDNDPEGRQGAAALRTVLRVTLSLRASEDNLRQSNDRLVMEMRTLQDERERAEAMNAQYVQLAEDFALATDELEKLNQEKNKFFSIIAHDLRSPFTALLGFSTLLAQRADKLDTDKVRQYAQQIHGAGERVFKLLENLLEWSRLQMDRVETRPKQFALGDVATQTLSVLGPVAQEKGVQLLERGQAPEVWADPDMVDAVIRNLVNNAIKFTPQGGSIALIYETDTDANLARIGVMDTGVGMDEVMASKLFKLSENVTTAGTDGEKGTGLGLLMCMDLVARNGGKIEVDSMPGSGSTFTFTLPLEAPGTVDVDAQEQHAVKS